MTPDAHNAPVRQFQRHAARLKARLEPHADHAEQFRLAFPDAFSDLAVTDVSQGGMGFLAGVMFPKSLKLIVHVEVGGPRSMTVRGIVRRCVIVDHTPTFQIGIQFQNPTGVEELALVKHVAAAKQAEKDLVGAGANDN